VADFQTLPAVSIVARPAFPWWQVMVAFAVFFVIEGNVRA